MNSKNSNQKRKSAFKIITPGVAIRLGVLATVLLIFCYIMFQVPGKSYTGPMAALDENQIQLKDELAGYVRKLAGEIRERNVWQYKQLSLAAEFITTALKNSGYDVQQQAYEVEGKTCYNLIAEITGTKQPDEIIVIGAHYDSIYSCPGANDNASGVAGTLALARLFAGKEPAKTLRFVFFANEEPPYYHTDQMGSVVYAKSCRAKNENITAMLTLETIGYYSDQPHSQKYPFPFNLIYPSTGNFIGFISNLSSRSLLHKTIASFRKHSKFPSQGGAVPEIITGVGWSDHWSFWKQGYKAIMVTDTAPFRYPYYHTTEDTLGKIDYERLAIVISGLQAVVADLAGSKD